MARGPDPVAKALLPVDRHERPAVVVPPVDERFDAGTPPALVDVGCRPTETSSRRVARLVPAAMCGSGSVLLISSPNAQPCEEVFSARERTAVGARDRH